MTAVHFVPHAYQQRAAKFVVGRGAAGLFMDPGLGKTASTLAAVMALQKQGIVKRVLVVAPLRVIYAVWPAEVGKWAEFAHMKVSVVHGPAKADALKTEADIYCINPEGLEWLERQKGWHFDMLVVDESTKFKHASTKRFKIMRRLLPRFRRRVILTGTPAPNGLMDLFGQVYLLDQGHALGAYITKFRMQYFDPAGFGGYDWRLKRGGEKAIYDAIAPLVIRLDEQDYLQLPPLSNVTIPVDLPVAARRIYAQVEAEFISKLAGGEIVAANAAVATAKLRQVASGGCYMEDGRVAAHIHDAKTEAIVDLVEQLAGQAALVAYDTHHDLERLQKGLQHALGHVPPYLGGGVAAKKTNEIVDAWNRGEIPVLLVQPQTASHGLNLQGAGRAVIWHTLTWDLEAYEQLIRRVWRQGQTRRVFVYHVTARGTIDDVIMARLSQKAGVQRSLLDDLRARYLPRNAKR